MDATDANLFAYVALLLWVPITFALFAFLRLPLAAAVAYLGAMLFLPERVQFDLSGIPPLDKHSLTALCVLGGCLWKGRTAIRRARIGRGFDLLIVVLVLSAVGTALTNGDPLHFGPTTLVGHSMRDALALAIHDLFYMGIPFFVGRIFYRDRASVNLLFRCLVIAGVIYSAFILVELRLSPQWHYWIYGFHQHQFIQVFRFGGWRPMVFMGHGLALSMFVLVSAIAATSLARLRTRLLGFGAGAYAAWMTVVLVLCKSTASILFGLLVIPAATLFKPRGQLWLAVAFAVIVITYPTTRAYDLFPTAKLTSLAGAVSAERARSLAFRFTHEDALLERARQRLAFGWGGYRRNAVFDDEGRDISVTDGFWVLQLGVRGVFAYIAAYGLLLIPIFMAFKRVLRMRPDTRWQVSGLGLMIAAYSVDMIPNGLFNSLPFFLAGALAGAISGLGGTSEAEDPESVSSPSTPSAEPARTPESLY